MIHLRRRLILMPLMLLASSAHALDINDVSLLLPLPSATHSQDMLMTSTLGLGGPLLPTKVSTALPRLVAGRDTQSTYQDDLRVVAIRLDPCFQEGHTPIACRQQIRMVWQPLLFEPDRSVSLDAALHTFYDMDSNQWSQFTKAYDQLLNEHQRMPQMVLGVHPLLAQGGYQSDFWQDLRKLITQFAGTETLSRVTLMNLDFTGNQWIFIGFEVENLELRPIPIPNLERPAQVVRVSSANQTEFQMDVFPTGLSETSLLLLDDSQAFTATHSEEEIAETLTEWKSFEDPRVHNPGTTECSGCHIASSVMTWSEQRLDPRIPDEGYFFTNRLRAFGYFGTEAQISNRVRNESAEVLKNWF